MKAINHLATALIVTTALQLQSYAQTACNANGCSLPDHLGDVQLMLDFAARAKIPIRQANCPRGILGTFSSAPASTGTLTLCNAALARGVAGVRDTFQHEMVHATQFCRARNNGAKGFWTISDRRDQILDHSQQVGSYRHAGGSYGLLSEHEAYTYENARLRDVLYWFNRFCIERKKSISGSN